MKKIILSLFIMFLVTAAASSQVKVRFFVANPTITGGNVWSIQLRATVPTGQTWRVGSCNIRVNWTTSTNPAGVTILPDATVLEANSNIHNNANYGTMTTTSILGGATISLNIVRNPSSPCFTFGPGTYTLGRLRFNRLDSTACIRPVLRTTGSGPAVVYDSLTQLTYAAGWDTLVNSPAGCIRLDYLTGIEEENNNLPTVYKLYNNYPNPFNPATTIKYDVPNNAFVKLTVYDILGKQVAQLVNKEMVAGRYEATWDASNYASGTYIYKFESGEFTDVKKMILIK